MMSLMMKIHSQKQKMTTMSRAMKYDPDTYDDDLEVDISFGRWLRERRIRCSYSLSAAARFSGLSEDRIEELENGEAVRGITRSEAECFSPIYGVDVRAILQRAVTG